MALTNDEDDAQPTIDEHKADFLENVHILCRTWKADKDIQGFGTCPFEGLAFSILNLIDEYVLRPTDPETGKELEKISGNLHSEFCEMIRAKDPRPRETITLELSDVKIVRNME